MKDELYPVTVIKDRYNGTYSKALWAAFNLHEAPEGASDSDPECMDFWARNEDPVGKGNTPDAAVADLEAQVVA